jgi:hypothetical protein
MTMRHMLCAAALVYGAALPAQNCLGGPNGNARHSLGLIFAGPQGAEGDDGGLGASFGVLTAAQQTARVEFNLRTVMPDNEGSSVEDFNYTRFVGTLARPLGPAKEPAATGMMSGLCAIGQLATTIKSSYSDESELGRAPSPATAAYSMAAGGAWAFSTPAFGFYAGPLFGISSADDATAYFVTVHTGGGVQLGRVLLNAEVNTPLGIEGAKKYLEVRAGWMW